MDLAEILQKIANIGIPIGVIILLGLIKIPKLEINIWKWFGKLIGKTINEDLTQKVDKIEEKVDALEKNDKEQERSYAENRALSCRRRIIQFADEIRRGLGHSQEGFNIVLNDITNYTNYCNSHPGFKNDQAGASIELIKEVHAKCLRENNFL